MAYLEQEQKIAYAASEQVIWLKDIINKIEDEIYNDRIKREGGEE